MITKTKIDPQTNDKKLEQVVTDNRTLTLFSKKIEFLTVYLWIIRSHFRQNIFSIMISSQYIFEKI